MNNCEELCQLQIQLFKTIILSYNVNRDKNKFLDNLKLFSDELKKVQFRPIKKNIKDIDEKKFPLCCIYEFKNIPEIKDKDILYENKFINIFQDILEKIIYMIAFYIENIGDFIDILVRFLNNITLKDYIIIDCSMLKKEDYSYNCGRAFIQIKKDKSRFLVFNTNDDATLDANIIKKYSNIEQEYYQNTLIFKEGNIEGDVKSIIDILNTTGIFENKNLDETKFINKLQNVSKKIKKQFKLKVPIIPTYIVRLDFDNFSILFPNEQDDNINKVIIIKDLIEKKETLPNAIKYIIDF